MAKAASLINFFMLLVISQRHPQKNAGQKLNATSSTCGILDALFEMTFPLVTKKWHLEIPCFYRDVFICFKGNITETWVKMGTII